MEIIQIKNCYGLKSYLWIGGALAPLEEMPELLQPLRSFPKCSLASRFLERLVKGILEIADAEFASSLATRG